MGKRKEKRSALDRTREAFTQANSDWSGWLSECEEDFKFRLGDQWADADKAVLNKQGRPILNLNIIKKPCDLITGYERQNQTSLKVMPIEKSDQTNADYLTELYKWASEYGHYGQQLSDAFNDAVTCGIGWLHPHMDYKKDPISGDVVVSKENPFRIMFDTETTQHDLTDCGWIIRHAWLSRERAIELHPDFEDDISSAKTNSSNFAFQKPVAVYTDYVNIVEHWRKQTEKRNFLIHLLTGDMKELTDKEASKMRKLIKNKGNKPLDPADPEGDTYSNFTVVTRDVQVIKMTAVCEDDILLYDGDNPFGTDEYPFIPVFGSWTPAINDLVLKIQGVVRLLKDPQREKNKRRSKLLHATMQLPFSNWLVQRGSLENPDELKKSSSPGNVVQYEGSKPEQTPPQQISQGLIQLEEMFSNDIREIGPNADMLGMSGQQGGSGPSAPGITIQIRQKQGLTSIQELFDNYARAKNAFGRYVIKLMTQNFMPEKMVRITGKAPPPGITDSTTGRYDSKIEDAPNTPTYRAYMLMLIMELMNKGVNVPPDMVIEASDLPQEFKDQMQKSMKAQQEAASQQAQLQTQKETQAMELEKARVELEYKKLELEGIKAGMDAATAEAFIGKTEAETEKIQGETQSTGLKDVLEGYQSGEIMGAGMEQAGVPEEVLQQPQPGVEGI